MSDSDGTDSPLVLSVGDDEIIASRQDKYMDDNESEIIVNDDTRLTKIVKNTLKDSIEMESSSDASSDDLEQLSPQNGSYQEQISSYSTSLSSSNPNRPAPIITNDRLEWVAGVHISSQAVKRKVYQFFGDLQVEWKGLKWYILLQFTEKYSPGGFDAYVGYLDVPDDVKSALHLNVTFQFFMLNENMEIVAQSRSTDHQFSLSEKEDRGFDAAFEYNSTIDNSRYQQALPKPLASDIRYQGYDKTFFIKVVLVESFQPERVMTAYNSKISTGLVGLENLGATCYLNSLLQMLFHINAFRKAVYQLPHKDEVYGSSTTLALQNVFRQLQMSTREVNTQDLLTAFGWTSQDAFAQQDVQEMMRILLDKLEEKMKGTIVDGVIHNLFCGSVRSYIKCVNVDYSSIREEEFYDIQLDVKGCSDLHESFRKYIAKEMLEGENQYDAGEYGKQNAEKGVIFTKFPPVMTILLKRFDFDLQRMRFIKIHDEYKFTTRINLDAYLAEDVTSKSHHQHSHQHRPSNTYVLHSVLVHMGDVGGGHYYAFIRPSIGYSYDINNQPDDGVTLPDVINSWPSQEISSHDYSHVNTGSLNQPMLIESYRKKAERDGKWFKFNDDCVNEVREYEAVNYSYGRSYNALKNNFSSSISSAYMLVYIREDEAKSIMAEVVIPPDLTARLEREFQLQHAEFRRRQRQMMYKTIQYATEEDVRSFRSYSRHEDFLSIDSLNRMRFINGSRRLSILWRICRNYAPISPGSIHLRYVSTTKRYGVYRVQEDLDLKDYLDNCFDDDIFYIHIDHDPFTKQAPAIEKLFNDVRVFEEDWLDELRLDLQSLPDFELMALGSNDMGDDTGNLGPITMEYDFMEGCGLFCNNEPMINLLSDQNRRKSFTSRLSEIEKMVASALQNIIKSYAPPKDSFIGFFKLFDPYGLLPVSIDQNISHDMIHHQSYAIDKKRKGSYIPIKYLTSTLITESTTLADIIDLIQDAIDLVYEKNNVDVKNRLQLGRGNRPERMLLCLGPNGTGTDIIFRSHDDDDDDEKSDDNRQTVFSAISTLTQYVSDRSAVFIIDMHLRLDSKQLPSLLPFNRLNTASEWLQYMATKKTFHIQPYSATDLDIMINSISAYHQRKIHKKQLLQLKRVAAESKLTSANSITTTTTATSLINKKNSFDAMNSNSHAHINSADDASSDDSDIDSISDNSSIISSDVDMDTDASIDQLGNIGYSYAEFPLNMTLKEIEDHIRKNLKCGDDINLSFFLLSEKENTASAQYQMMHSIRPMLGHPNKMLSSFLQERKVSSVVLPGRQNEANVIKYFMYYQILPYALLQDDGKDIREKYRFLDINIIDNRLRMWRQRYLYRNVSGSTVNHNANVEPSGKRARIDTGTQEDNSIQSTSSDSSNLPVHPTSTLTVQIPDHVDPVANILDIDSNDIIWPPEHKSQRLHEAFLSDYRIVTCIQNNVTVHLLMEHLRHVIGIPENINEYGSVSNVANHHNHSDIEADHANSEDTTSTAEDITSLLKPLPLESDDTQPLIESDGHNKVSKMNEWWKPLSNPAPSKPHAKERCFDVISEVDSESHNTAFPLVLLFIKDNMILDIYTARNLTKELIHCWIEAFETTSYNMMNKLAIQHVPRGDLIWMRGEHTTIRSTIVSVFSFTLLGNACNPCPFLATEPLAFPGPIITYIREDDDYDTICRRIAETIGETYDDAGKYRLAVVHKKIPTFVARSNGNGQDLRRSPSPSPLYRQDSIDSASSNEQVDRFIGPTPNPSPMTTSIPSGPLNHHTGNLWSLLQEKYPQYTNFSYEQARDYKSMGPRSYNQLQPLPMIGIQRSSVHSNANRIARPSSSIRISG